MNGLLLGLLCWCVIGVLASVLIGRDLRVPRADDPHEVIPGRDASAAASELKSWPARFSS